MSTTTHSMTRSARPRTRQPSVSPWAWGAIATAVLVTGIGAWWALEDRSLLLGDAFKHFTNGMESWRQVQDGDWLGPYTTARIPDYGPVVYYVMVAAFALTGGPGVPA